MYEDAAQPIVIFVAAAGHNLPGACSAGQRTFRFDFKAKCFGFAPPSRFCDQGAFQGLLPPGAITARPFEFRVGCAGFQSGADIKLTFSRTEFLFGDQFSGNTQCGFEISFAATGVRIAVKDRRRIAEEIKVARQPRLSGA